MQNMADSRPGVTSPPMADGSQHNLQQPVSPFLSDGHSVSGNTGLDGSTNDKYGLNSSCSSDKFSTLDDMVSKIVDDESNFFSTDAMGNFGPEDSRSHTTSDVFSFDE